MVAKAAKSFGPLERKTDQVLKVKYLPTQSIRLDSRNPRVHTNKQIRQIAQSIETFGFNVPVLIDQDLLIIAGHGRLLAARLLALDEVPAISLEHLTESQRRAFMIADNRLNENSTWDESLLAEQLQILAKADIDFALEVTGFETGEIDIYLECQESETGTEVDVVPAPSKGISVTRLGDCWLLGQHRVLCGNVLDPKNFSRLMGGKRATAMFADPPYNVPIDGHATGLGKTHHAEFAMASGEMTQKEFVEFLMNALTFAAAHCVDGSIHFVCMDWRHLGELLTAGKSVYSEVKNLCVWAKTNAGMGSFYRSQHELIVVFKKGKRPHRNNIQLGSLGRYRTNIWTYPSPTSFGESSVEGSLSKIHPTVKPAALVADAILDCTMRRDIVLDPFLGSGTTIIAAERTGRIGYGLEIDPKFVDLVIRRWQEMTGRPAVLEDTKETFDQVQAVALGK